VPESWTRIAETLLIPFDDALQVHLEYDGYTNQTIKQVDPL
jgi:trehalose/maltose hydrolase-like predicted phosphorylase